MHTGAIPSRAAFIARLLALLPAAPFPDRPPSFSQRLAPTELIETLPTYIQRALLLRGRRLFLLAPAKLHERRGGRRVELSKRAERRYSGWGEGVNTPRLTAPREARVCKRSSQGGSGAQCETRAASGYVAIRWAILPPWPPPLPAARRPVRHPPTLQRPPRPKWRTSLAASAAGCRSAWPKIPFR